MKFSKAQQVDIVTLADAYASARSDYDYEREAKMRGETFVSAGDVLMAHDKVNAARAALLDYLTEGN